MIRHLISNRSETFPEGAHCPFAYCGDGGGQYRPGNGPAANPCVVYDTHHGLCLSERERNSYHDSDFFMTVWNPVEKRAEEILFATTRGWMYPCFASNVDATDEVRAEYDAWRREQNRRWAIQDRWNKRRKLNKLRDELQLESRADVEKLQQATGRYFESYRALLRVKNFRSDFRRSLNEQVRAWVADSNPKYRYPLSRNQQNYL